MGKKQTATMVADMWCILAELPYLKTWLVCEPT